MNSPLVSIIIPTFNRGDTLKDAVQSVLSQTYKNLEVIVVDDCSAKPATESLVEAGIFDPRLRIIRQEHNQGQAAARNAGAKQARGKYLAFLDDDDLFYPAKLSRQLQFMRKGHHKVSVTDFTLPGDHHLYSARNSAEDPDWLILSGRFLALPSTMMIRKSLYENIGGFDSDPAIRRTEDLDFALRLYQSGSKLTVMPEFLSHYSGFHAAKPEFELKALEGVERKHRHTFNSGSKAAELFGIAIEWKKSHIDLTNRPIMRGLFRMASLALHHPIHFGGMMASVIENPVRRVIPPADRPRKGMPFNPKLSYPYIPV